MKSSPSVASRNTSSVGRRIRSSHSSPPGWSLVVGHRQRQADREVARAGPDGVDRLAVGGDQGVVDRAAAVPVPHPRREDPVAPPHGGHHVGLVERAGHPDQVAQVRGGPLAEPGEAIGARAGLPGAGRGQPPGMGEVVEGDHRHDPVLVAGGRHPPVVVEGDRGELALLGFDPAPLEREAVAPRTRGRPPGRCPRGSG